MPRDKIYGLFLGPFGHQMLGKQTYRDEANGLVATVDFGAYFFKKQDFVWGEILQNGERICEIKGNYTGFVDFDEARYWDYREGSTVNYPIVNIDPALCLPSDSRHRTDGLFLLERPVEEA